MARTIRDARLDTRSSRLKLKARREPYWRKMFKNVALGYRRPAQGAGTWIARHYTKMEGRTFQALGVSDDIADANGMSSLSFDQAQERARAWLDERALDEGEGAQGPYLVKEAIADYEKDYQRRGGKALSHIKASINSHILPALGSLDVAKLTERRIEGWVDALAATQPRLRTKKGKAQRFKEIDLDDPEVIRRRRHTANKVLTILKAALNLAFQKKKVRTNQAWLNVKAFRGVDVPRVRYLTDAESQRLVNACAGGFRQIVTAALLTGARFSELARMKAGDFNVEAATIHIPESKSGKPRHVHLTDEGRDFFEQCTTGKERDALIFPRDDKEAWGPSHQTRPLKAACISASIKPSVGFHILRHSYASRLAMNGVPMRVIAEQLGHADTRITEKHYAHFAPSYIGDTVRAAFGILGVVKPGNVAGIKRVKATLKSSTA
jgi:integrase